MNNTLLLQQFDLLATAPGGVAKLRELILTLAVQGKLVPQDPADEPASELLKRIRVEKDRLIAERKIRRSKPLDAIGDDELMFELPSNWEWERLGNLGDWGAGATPPRSTSAYYGGSIPWFKSGELTADFISESEETVTEEALKNCSLRLNQVGDVLVAMYGATIGKTAILSVAGTTNQAVCACTPFSGLQNTYLLLLLKAIKPYLISLGAGGAQPNISREKIISVVIGVPPLPEQARIVARVEELMRVCDALEAKGQQQAAHHTQLVSTLLGSLTDSAASDEQADDLPTRWQRVAQHFDTLLDRPEAIDALEQTILQLAVRGQLVPQDPTDEPASVLLQRIRAEKDRLIAEGKIKRDKPLAPVAEDEQPFELPVGWEWVRLIDLMPEFQNGASSRGDLGGKTITVIRLADIKEKRISLADTRQVPIAPADIAKHQLAEGDILITRVNGSADIVGQFNLCDRPVEAIYCDHFIRMRIDRRWVEPNFCALFGESALVRAAIKGLFITTAGQKTVNQGHIGSLLFPLPPLPEQARIVARVAHLCRLCAELRQRLTQSQTTQAALAEALVNPSDVHE